MEHEIEIEFVHRRGKIANFFRKSNLIQTIPFEIGFLFRNRGDKPLIGAMISAIQWRSAQGQSMFSTINKSFHLDTLNPREKKIIWIEKTGTYAHGLCQIDLTVVSDKKEEVIKTFQVNPFTKEVEFYGRGIWTDFFFIRSKESTNKAVQIPSCYILR